MFNILSNITHRSFLQRISLMKRAVTQHSLTQRLHFSTTSPNSTSNTVVSTDLTLWQRFRAQQTIWEAWYKQEKEKNPASDELLRFVLKNIVYGSLTVFAAYFFNKYVQNNQRLNQIEIDLNRLIEENRKELDAVKAIRIQPLLYLTTNLKQEDIDHYNQAKSMLTTRQQLLRNHKKELQHLELFHQLKAKDFQRMIEQQIKILTITLLFNETIWFHKHRQYVKALEECSSVIKELDGVQKDPYVYSLLAAAYNTQAKLEACVAYFSANEKEKTDYRSKSLSSYELAIKSLEKGGNNPSEKAILLNSKAYLLNDCKRFGQALELRKEANSFKPNDEHILCGIGLDLHEIEKEAVNSQKRFEFDNAKLQEAYGYFTRALQLNDKVPNIYVSRGKLLVDMKKFEEAIVDFTQALSLDKTHSNAHLEHAYLLARQGKCDEAEKHFSLGLLPLLGGREHDIEEARKKLQEAQKQPIGKHKACSFEGNRFFISPSTNSMLKTSLCSFIST